MRAKASSLFLVKSASGKMVKRPTFRTDATVPQSGIYKIRHKKHRLPHEVILFKDQQFPRCAKCQDAVAFELVRAVNTDNDGTRGLLAPICVYELPALDDEQEIAG
ncbi:MAG TPA: hypothetical protein VN223_11230 [Candidatus Elarobacter sp.]|nr:hypothetical protein [Candidatus Elarobacter sp.]